MWHIKMWHIKIQKSIEWMWNITELYQTSFEEHRSVDSRTLNMVCSCTQVNSLLKFIDHTLIRSFKVQWRTEDSFKWNCRQFDLFSLYACYSSLVKSIINNSMVAFYLLNKTIYQNQRNLEILYSTQKALKSVTHMCIVMWIAIHRCVDFKGKYHCDIFTQ